MHGIGRGLLVTVALGTVIAALQGAAAEVASPSASAETTWLAVSSPGLVHDGAAGVASLLVTLDGSPVASVERALDSGGPVPLGSLVALSPFPATSASRAITVVAAWNGLPAIELAGNLADGASGLALTVSRVSVDRALPLRLSGDDAFVVEKTWSDAAITIGLAWESVAAQPVTVRLETDSPAYAAQTVLATAAADGAWAARFTLSQVPAELSWTATILAGSSVAGTASAHVAFATRTVSDASFSAPEGSTLAAAGGFHEVAKRASRVAVASSLFGPAIAGTSACASGGTFGSMSGEAWRLAQLSRAGQPCGEEAHAAATSVTTHASPVSSDTLRLAGIILAGLVLVAGAGYGVWQLVDRRRGPFRA